MVLLASNPLICTHAAKHPSDTTRATYNKIFASEAAALFQDPAAKPPTSYNENKQIQKPSVPMPPNSGRRAAARDQGANMKGLLSWDS